jgi:hypothetical protein
VLIGLALVAALLLPTGCSTDVSHQARYQRKIGTSLALKREQALWKKEGSYHAEGASYVINDPAEDLPKATRVGTIRPGTHVMLVAVRRRNTMNGEYDEYAIVQLTRPAERPDPFLAELHMSPTPAGVRDFPW